MQYTARPILQPEHLGIRLIAFWKIQCSLHFGLDLSNLHVQNQYAALSADSL